MKKHIKLIITFLFILIEEAVLSLLVNNTISSILPKMVFSFMFALILDIFTDVFKSKANKIIYNLTIIVICVIFNIYYIYYDLLGSVLSIFSIKNGVEQAFQFYTILLNKLLENWQYILIQLFLGIVIILFNKKIDFEPQKNKSLKIKIISLLFTYIISIICINTLSKPEDIYSYKNIYYNINNNTESLKKFGLITTIRLDIQRTLFGFEEKELYQYTDENGEKKVINKDEYNMIDIPFEELIATEENDTIKEIYKYILEQEPTRKNEYTGKYKDKNLIVFVAESFSNLAIDEEITPTLYKMANSGYNFSNFYTPLFPVSTADGEYLTDTSLLPVEGIWSIENVEGKYFPYSYAEVLKDNGYKSYAYHNYDYQYYKRDKYFPTMGYDVYLGNGNGLEERMDFSKTPSSDYDMVKNTIDDYIDDDKFVTYYMTMSGHMEYDNTNAIVVKNWDEVKDLPYSDKAKAYLATQIELDRALEELLNRLEAVGKLDDTIIVITGDHYPYGLTLQEMQELSEKTLDYEFEKFNMPFILYDATIQETIHITKFASSLDVLPTILNLFGEEYDSRLLMGKDIFSDSESLIIFSNRSFISEQGRYNSTSEQLENYTGEMEKAEYITKMKKIIYQKYKYSRLILENDFYNLLKSYL